MALGESHEDLAAALGARRDLGNEYDKAIAEGFVDRVSKEIDARVDMRMAQIAAASPSARRRQRGGTFLAVSSLVLGIPISAIAGDFGHFAGLAVAWGGIVLVNGAHAFRRDPNRLPVFHRPPGFH